MRPSEAAGLIVFLIVLWTIIIAALLITGLWKLAALTLIAGLFVVYLLELLPDNE